MVMPTSAARAHISMASTPSAINSPAPAPTMPTPRTRSVFGSMSNLVRPSGRSMVTGRPDAAQGNLATVISRPCSLACVSVRPAQAISGSVKTTAGIAFRSEGDFGAGDGFYGGAAFMHSFVGKHRFSGNVADGVDCGIGGLALAVDFDESLLIDFDFCFVEAGDFGIWAASD